MIPCPPPRRLAACLALAAALSVPSTAQLPADLPPNFELVNVGGIYDTPVGFAFVPDGRILLIEKRGRVLVHSAGADQATPFLDLGDEVNNWGSRGLLGITVHPGFVPDGGATSWVYLLYTVSPVPGQDVSFDHEGLYSFSRLTRYRALTSGPDLIADLASREVLLGEQLPDGTVPDGIASLYESHSNGSLRFADDGTLLVAAGDGAHWDFVDTGGFDPEAFDDYMDPRSGLKGPMPAVQDSGALRSQDLRSLAGKILRVDPATGDGLSSNPFFDGDPTSNPSRVWALGLRNPFRTTLRPGSGASDPALGDAGDLYVGEVGETTWEELHLCRGGENFGWPCIEGIGPYAPFDGFAQPLPNPLGLPDCVSANPGTPTSPSVAWHHNDASLVEPAGIYLDDAGVPDPAGFQGACSIGGAFYPGGSYPAEYDGRMFFADYAERWIRTLEVDAQGDPVAVRDFGENVPALVQIEADPVSGDLFALAINDPAGQLFRLRHGSNLTPTAVLSASVLSGDAPLTVAFDGTGSSDPNLDVLSYEWDFDDGSPLSLLPSPEHTFTADGAYNVTLRVTDPGGLSSTAAQVVTVGDLPQSVRITSPAAGAAFATPTTVHASAIAFGFGGGTLTWDWQVDEYHNTHVHPQVGSASQPDAFDFDIDVHGELSDLVYYSIEVTVSDGQGGMATDRVFVYPDHKLRDVTGTSPVIAKLTAELSPPVPLGTGNTDVEVVRDAVLPPPGSTDPELQYDTSHNGDQGTDDWIGLELAAAPAPEQRFVGLTFQEGLHLADGGWFETLSVETRIAGNWFPVQNLKVVPDYPFADDGSSFDAYELSFDPAFGDAVRLRGDPGGSTGYVSVAELRARIVAIDDGTTPGLADLTAEGTIAAKLFELAPPVPQGVGNLDAETIRNGTFPPFGSRSSWGQFDTSHGGDQAGEDWVGYLFPTTKLFTRLEFQEGRNFADGGWFDALDVQVLPKGAPDWVDVTGLVSTPRYPGTVSPFHNYETFLLDFDPVPARGIRVHGDPGGAGEYVSVGELRVYGSVPALDCGWSTYGPGGLPADELVLGAWETPSIASTVTLESVGGPTPGFGWIGLSALPAAIQLWSGTLLLDPLGLFLFGPALLDGAGELALPIPLPNDPTVVGAQIHWQAFALEAGQFVDQLRYSNGLVMKICP